jgi:hypothetical protein
MRALLLVALSALPIGADVSLAPNRCGHRVCGFELRLDMRQRTFKAGETIVVRWTLVNFSKAATCKIPREWDQLFPKSEDFVHGSEGRIEFTSGPTPVRNGPIACSAGIRRKEATVYRNGKLQGEIEIRQNLPAGTYDVKLTYYAYDKGLISGAARNIESNTIRIQVKD